LHWIWRCTDKCRCAAWAEIRDDPVQYPVGALRGQQWNDKS
jgi:hypothetical protein